MCIKAVSVAALRVSFSCFIDLRHSAFLESI